MLCSEMLAVAELLNDYAVVVRGLRAEHWYWRWTLMLWNSVGLHDGPVLLSADSMLDLVAFDCWPAAYLADV